MPKTFLEKLRALYEKILDRGIPSYLFEMGNPLMIKCNLILFGVWVESSRSHGRSGDTKAVKIEVVVIIWGPVSTFLFVFEYVVGSVAWDSLPRLAARPGPSSPSSFGVSLSGNIWIWLKIYCLISPKSRRRYGVYRVDLSLHKRRLKSIRSSFLLQCYLKL